MDDEGFDAVGDATQNLLDALSRLDDAELGALLDGVVRIRNEHASGRAGVAGWWNAQAIVLTVERERRELAMRKLRDAWGR